MGDLPTKSGVAKGFMTEYNMAKQRLKDQNKAAFKFLQDPKNTTDFPLELSESRIVKNDYDDHYFQESKATIEKGSYADDDPDTADIITIDKYQHSEKSPARANGDKHPSTGYKYPSTGYKNTVHTSDTYNQVGNILEVSELSKDIALEYAKDRDYGTMKIDLNTGNVLEATGKYSRLSE